MKWPADCERGIDVRFRLTLLLVLAQPCQASPVKQGETVVFFPVIGRRVDRDAWEVQIHGCVFKIERRAVTAISFGQVSHEVVSVERPKLF